MVDFGKNDKPVDPNGFGNDDAPVALAPPPIDVYSGIADPNDVRVKAKEVYGVATKFETPLQTVEQNFDIYGVADSIDNTNISKISDEAWQIMTEPSGINRPRWEEFIDAVAIGEAKVGSAFYGALAMSAREPTSGVGMAFQLISPEQKKKNRETAARFEEKAGFLWELSQDPSLAAKNTDIASRALVLIGGTIPYITVTTVAFIAAGPGGSFVVGSLVEGNSAYRNALDNDVPEAKARMIGVGVGLVAGAVETFGGKIATRLLDRAIAKITDKVLKAGAVFTVGTIVEALEEGAQEIAHLVGEETFRDIDWAERVNRVLGAMAGGAFLGGTSRGGIMAVDRLSFERNPKRGTVSAEAQDRMDSLKKDFEQIRQDGGPLQMERLRERLNQERRIDEHADVEDALTKKIMSDKGIPEYQARAIARAAVDEKYYTKDIEVPPPIEEAVPPISEAVKAPEPAVEPSEAEIAPVGVTDAKDISRGIPPIRIESGKDIKGKTFFHGTFAEFGTFRQQGNRGSESVDMGFHFGSKQTAETVLVNRKIVEAEGQVGGTFARGIDTSKPRVVAVELDIKNPLRLEEERGGNWSPNDVIIKIRNKLEAGENIEGISEEDIDDLFNDEIIQDGENILELDDVKQEADLLQKWLNERGYDGIVYENTFEGGGDSLIAFKPEQVKIIQPPAPAKPAAPTEPKITPEEELKAIEATKEDDEVEVPIEQKKAEKRDILGGVDPFQQIHKALADAKRVRPITEATQKAELKKRVGAAAGALKTNLKKGVPAEEAVFRSTGLLKGPLAEYNQVYESIEDILEPGAKNAAYQQIAHHPDLQYFEVVNTTISFKKLLAGADLTPGDVQNIERVFGKQFEEFTEVRETRSGLYERLVTLWKAGLLTGIKTSGLNVMSTAAHAMSETAALVPATFIDSGIALFSKERTTAFTVRGYPTGFVEGGVKGWDYLRTGHSERDVGQKYDYKKTNYGKSPLGKAQQAVTDFTFHLLGAEDQPFYYGAFSRSLYSSAIAQAKTKGLKGKARKDFVNNLQQNPTDIMLQWAKEDAEGAVYTNRTKLGDLGRAIQKFPGGEIIAPFTRTPSAVAMQIINYSPIGIVSEINKQIKKGEFSQRNISRAGGRSVIGTGTLWLGTQLFKAGLITLGFPKGERERKLQEAAGIKPNSILINGKYRDVQVLGPVGNLLIIGAYFQQALESKGSPTEAIVTAMAGGAKSFTEQTFVRGVNLAVTALVDPEASFERWFTSMAGSVVPTLVADIAQAQDDVQRLAIGPKERIQSRIPIYRKGLPPKINIFGQDLPRYGGNILESMIDPTRPSKIRQDVVVDELRRLFEKDIKVSPTQLGDKAGFDILTPEENTLLWQRSGELIYKLLFDAIKTEGYKGANDFVKGKMIDTLTKEAKDQAKAEIINIKLGQGKTIMELAESGLLTIDSLEALKFYRDEQ